MGYSESEKRDILEKVLIFSLQTLLKRSPKQYAPDFFIDATMKQAQEFIAKYGDRPEIDIWRQGRLDLYTRHLLMKLMIETDEDYVLSDDNFEAANALLEAEEMLGDKVSDAELTDCFDYTPEELARLRIIIQYFGGADYDSCLQRFKKKFKL